MVAKKYAVYVLKSHNGVKRRISMSITVNVNQVHVINVGANLYIPIWIAIAIAMPIVAMQQ